MAKKRISASLARIARESRGPRPNVNPRVSPQRALQLLKKVPGGSRLIERIESSGASATPTQIAYFTPRTWSGNVGFIDFRNTDLQAGVVDVTSAYQNNLVYFDARSKTPYDDISLKHPNGVVQAFFDIEEQAQVLAVAKLSSLNAKVYLTLDSPSYDGDSFRVQGNGVELAILKLRGPGVHRVNIIQRTKPRNPIWFHSITVFQI